MIDPKKVFVSIPTLSGEVCHETVKGLLGSAGLYGGVDFVTGCSEVNLARNLAVQHFDSLPQFDHMVFIDSDIGFSRQDFEFLMSGDEDAVYAPYSKKDGTGKPSEFGLGFARVKRSVFEKILDLKTANPIDGLPDPDGEPAVNFFFWQGAMVFEFFPSFATAAHHWSGEDHSFWKLVKMSGATVRVEERVRLRHWGRIAFTLPEKAAND